MRAQEARADRAGGDGRARVRPATERGTTADRLLALQRAAGNAAVTRAVQGEQHRHSSAGPVVQRAVWTFNGSTRTHNVVGQDSGLWYDDTGRTRTSADLRVDPASVHHGDKYDDVTRQLHSSGSVAFSRRGTIPDAAYPGRETRTRKAVVEAQQKMAAALALLDSAGASPNGPLLRALKSAFPVFQTATSQQIGQFLPRIGKVLRRVQAGLNSQGAQIALVGQTSPLDLGARGAGDAGVAGWVGPSGQDLLARLNPNHMKSEDLPPMDSGRSGPINLREEGEVAWYVIHEATHRFAGTLDYQYSSYEHELHEDTAQGALAAVLDPADAAGQEAEMLGRRVARDPDTYTGRNETARPQRQQNWYAMGRRALMNADSYAHFVMTATGSPVPRS
ncbi:hypothetical protein ACFYXC_17645 [Streptomyces sp. NPDC002701]|uniref:hypothetical protein n=1 Tax=Streptomyces sp. NPDC002701 TaxID=3364661 RepID=UPI00369B4EA3